MTDTASPLARGSFWRRVRFFALLTILVLLVVYVGLDWWSGRRLDATIVHFEQRYGPLPGSVGAPSVPPADNRARLVRAAAALVNAPSDQQFSAMSRLGRTDSVGVIDDDLRGFVDSNEQAIGLLAGLASRHLSSWEVDYGSGGDVPFLDIRNLGSALYLSALIDLSDGRPDDAVSRAGLGLDVASSLGNEPALIAQLIRIAIGLQALDATQRVLVAAEPSRAALEELAERLKACGEPDPIRMGLLGEAWGWDLSLARAERGRSSGGSVFGLLAGPFGRLARPLVRDVRTRHLALMESLLDLEAAPRPRPAPAALPQPRWWSPGDRMAGSATRGLMRSIETGDDFAAAVAAARTVVALRRYRLDRGAYPDDLTALVPAYLDALPINPWTGQPPVYARQGAGFSVRAGRGRLRPVAEWVVSR